MSKHIWLVWLAAGGVWVLYLGWLSGYQSGYEEGHARGWEFARRTVGPMSPQHLLAHRIAAMPETPRQID